MLAQADADFAARRWSAAARGYAQEEGPLPADALARWGLAAYLVGQDAVSDAARERAYHAHLAAGDAEAALRVGHWLAVALVLRGERARAGGWFGRLQELVETRGLQGTGAALHLTLSQGMMQLFGGDPAGAAVHLQDLLSQARGHDEPDLEVLTRNGLGQALVRCGRVPEGLARLDEAMVMATTDDRVSPQSVGLVYCAVIDTCRRAFDLERAQEWTEALSRWCALQPDLVPYRGQCLVHRAEILVLHGAWPDAQAEIERVFHRLGEQVHDQAAGMAYYQRGELYRLRGQRAEAEKAYLTAARCGHDPQPGLALLRLAGGDAAGAFAALRRALEETSPGADRWRLLPSYLSAALAVQDLDAARAAAIELRAAVAEQPVPWLLAVVAQCEGRLALAEGDAQGAARALREALTAWQGLGAPYDAASTRVDLAEACRRLGDATTAEVELDAARWAFEQLGAAPDLARLARDEGRGAPPLTRREFEVLRMLATGRSNRELARELFLSEKTVARHVANIFLKLGVGSRTAATAYAYEHGLV